MVDTAGLLGRLRHIQALLIVQNRIESASMSRSQVPVATHPRITGPVVLEPIGEEHLGRQKVSGGTARDRREDTHTCQVDGACLGG